MNVTPARWLTLAAFAQPGPQTAPTFRAAQPVRQQRADARERERLDQERRVARLIRKMI